MVKKPTKVFIRSMCLLAMLLLLSNCGPSLKTQIEQLEAEYSRLYVDQKTDIENYKVKQRSFDQNWIRWESSLSNEQCTQIKKCSEQLEGENVRCWKTLIDSLSTEQLNELVKIGQEFNSLNAIGDKIKERDRDLRQLWYKIDLLVRKKQIEDMNNLMLLGILLSNVHVSYGAAVQPPPQPDILFQWNIQDRLQRIENQLRWPYR